MRSAKVKTVKTQVYAGHILNQGVRIDFGFEVPTAATELETKAAFGEAILKTFRSGYLAVGEYKKIVCEEGASDVR